MEYWMLRTILRFIRGCFRDVLSFIVSLIVIVFIVWLLVKHFGFGVYVDQIWIWIQEFIADIKNLGTMF